MPNRELLTASNARGLIERAIRSLSASGETALYDGLYVVLKEFERERRVSTEVRRQALVLLSDGLDNRSRLAFDDVLDYARRVAVNIYVIALRGALAQVPRNEQDAAVLRADYALNTVTRESGGRLFFPKMARDLAGIYTAIAQELFSQYELGYMPVRSVSDGGLTRRRQSTPGDECPGTHTKRVLRAVAGDTWNVTDRLGAARRMERCRTG